jgi:hypothetical protein
MIYISESLMRHSNGMLPDIMHEADFPPLRATRELQICGGGAHPRLPRMSNIPGACCRGWTGLVYRRTVDGIRFRRSIYPNDVIPTLLVQGSITLG